MHCASLILLLRHPLAHAKGFSYPEAGFCLRGQWFMGSVIRKWIEISGVHHNWPLPVFAAWVRFCVQLKFLLRYLDFIDAVNTSHASLSMNSKWTGLWSSIKCWRTNRTNGFIPRSVSKTEKNICFHCISTSEPGGSFRMIIPSQIWFFFPLNKNYLASGLDKRWMNTALKYTFILRLNFFY